MPAIQTNILPQDILSLINQWSLNEIEHFVDQVLLISAQKKAPGFSNQETELLIKINEGVPYKLQQRYNTLILKRNNNTLTDKEYEELVALTDRIENIDAQRINYLSKLAKIRNTTLSKIMTELGIKESEYV